MKNYVNVITTLFDWSYDPRKHLMKEVIKVTSDWSDTVLVQHPVGLIGHFFTRFKQKIWGLLTGKYNTQRIPEDAVLFTPVIFFHYGLWHKNNILSKLDIFLFQYQLNKFLRKNYKNKKIILCLHMPKMYYIINKVKHDFLIYDYQDNFGLNPTDMGENIDLVLDAETNKKIIQKSNLVVCSAKVMYNYSLQFNPNTIYSPNGNDYELLTDNSHLDIVTEISNIDKPIVGYVGGIKDWLDYELLHYLITSLNDVVFVFIGHITYNAKILLDELLLYENFIHLGYKDQRILPAYLNKFTVGIIPFKINKFMEGVFPNKFFEYMACGIPIVTTALPELLQYSDLIGYSNNKEDFLANCKKAINNDFREKTKFYDEIAKQNSWKNRAILLNENLKDMLHI